MSKKNSKTYLIFLTLSFTLNSIYSWPTLYLYNQETPSSFEIITSDNISKTKFNYLKETKILVHGFMNDGNNSRILRIKNELLQSNDVNTIIVDWGIGASGPNYFAAKDNTVIVGNKVGQFLLDTKINPSKIHCIGHSLGAHICGFISKIVRLNRISGMDPAGPGFKGKPVENRLDKTDAEFVDVIHADWILGIQDPIGHINFYPNGGSVQPGCISILGRNYNNDYDEKVISEENIEKYVNILYSRNGELIGCSHDKSVYYYAESINSECQFKSIPCDKYNNFKNGKCACDAKIGCSVMGFHAQKNQEGTFYLTTNEKEPFCIK